MHIQIIIMAVHVISESSCHESRCIPHCLFWLPGINIYTHSSTTLPPQLQVVLTTPPKQWRTDKIENYILNPNQSWRERSIHMSHIHQLIVISTYSWQLGLSCISAVINPPEMIDIFLMRLVLQQYLAFINTLLWLVWLWYGLTIPVWVMRLWQVWLWHSLWQSWLWQDSLI